MNIIATELAGVVLLEPRAFGDQRGFFLETYHADRYRQAGVPDLFVQDNHSRSRRGVLRGLHYQLPHAQGKLVQVTRGQVFDVVVDIRRGSPSFGRWLGILLDDATHAQLYIPPGFAHGFCVVSDEADFVYKCTDYYHPEAERGIAWDDPAIGVEWPTMDFTLSPKDTRHPRLAEQAPDLLPLY